MKSLKIKYEQDESVEKGEEGQRWKKVKGVRLPLTNRNGWFEEGSILVP